MFNSFLSSRSKKNDARASTSSLESGASSVKGDHKSGSDSMTGSTSDRSMKKVVIVTGGSSGIGKSTAVEFAKLGYRVAITGLCSDSQLNSALQKMIDNSADHRADDFLTMHSDFGDMSQVEEIIPLVIKTFGRLDILVNNAGFQGRARGIRDADFFDDFLKVQQVNLHAPMKLCHLALPHLIETKGVIINVSSIADRVPMDTISYSVSKCGISMMTRCIANALEGKHVRCVGVAPGPTATNFARGIELSGFMTSLGRVGDSQELADTIVFLASDKASYIHGTIVVVDGGCHSKCGGAFRQPKLLRILT